MILRRPDLAIIRQIYPISRYAKDEYQRYMIFSGLHAHSSYRSGNFLVNL